MAGKDDTGIEASALIVEDLIQELTAILASSAARTSQYDRQTAIKLRYAIRWLNKALTRIKALKV